MKILHVCQYFAPWLGYQEFYLAREQIRHGHEVRVLSSNLRWPAGSGYSALSQGQSHREMPVGNSVEEGVPTTRLSVRAEPLGRIVLSGLADSVRAYLPDAVHAHGYLLPTTIQVAALKEKLRFRLLVDEHQLPHQAVPGAIHRLLRLGTALVAARLLAPLIDEFVAVAEGARSWMINEYLLPAERIEYIPLGADPEMFCPDRTAGEALRAQLGIPMGELVVLSSGKIAAHKRLDLLVDAMAGSKVPARLLLVGPADPHTLAELKVRAAQKGVNLQVSSSVAPGQLGAYFNLADVCAWPADCTISHIEAASCGKVIIIPNEAGIRDRVAAGNGLLVGPGDVRELREALEGLLSDEGKRRAMGAMGRAMVIESFSWPAIARRFEALYRSTSMPSAEPRAALFKPGDFLEYLTR